MKKKDAIKMLSNTKVYVDGRSEEIQEKLFYFGFKWLGGKDKVRFLNSPFLFLKANMYIGHDNDMIFFKSHDFKEIKADDILSISIDKEYGFESFDKEYNLKPFDKVLVRDNLDENWEINIFSHMVENENVLHKFVTICDRHKYCIPFEGNEHLIGTTDLPDV